MEIFTNTLPDIHKGVYKKKSMRQRGVKRFKLDSDNDNKQFLLPKEVVAFACQKQIFSLDVLVNLGETCKYYRDVIYKKINNWGSFLNLENICNFYDLLYFHNHVMCRKCQKRFYYCAGTQDIDLVFNGVSPVTEYGWLKYVGYRVRVCEMCFWIKHGDKLCRVDASSYKYINLGYPQFKKEHKFLFPGERGVIVKVFDELCKKVLMEELTRGWEYDDSFCVILKKIVDFLFVTMNFKKFCFKHFSKYTLKNANEQPTGDEIRFGIVQNFIKPNLPVAFGIASGSFLIKNNKK